MTIRYPFRYRTFRHILSAWRVCVSNVVISFVAKGRKTFYSLIILLVRKLREEVVDLHIWIIFLRSSMLVMIQEAFNKTTSFPEPIHPKYHELIRSILIHTISHNEQNIKLHFLAKTLWDLLIIFTVLLFQSLFRASIKGMYLN